MGSIERTQALGIIGHFLDSADEERAHRNMPIGKKQEKMVTGTNEGDDNG